MRKNVFVLGILVTPWWLFTVLLFGELQPGYSHLYHAASELGAFGASNPLAMNVLCFFLTGALVALAGLGFIAHLQSRGESGAAGWWVFGTASFNDRAFGLYTSCGFKLMDKDRTWIKVLPE